MSALYEGLAEILDIAPDAVGPELVLADHTWDSLAIVSTIALIDECSSKLVEAAALARCERVSDIEALIAASA
jgi:acyl carrier protein